MTKLLDVFTKAYEAIEESDPLRKKAWERFCEKGLPHFRSQGYRDLILKPLYQDEHRFENYAAVKKEGVLPQCKHSHLVMVNGRFDPNLSDWSALDGVEIMPLEEAKTSYGVFLEGRMREWVKLEEDPFALVNGAIHSKGLFIYAPPGLSLNHPLQILHIVSDDNPMIADRIHLVAGKGTRFKIYSTHQGGKAFLKNEVVDLVLEKEAKVSWVELNKGMEKAKMLLAMRASLKGASHLEVITSKDGGAFSRQDLQVSLLESLAHCDLRGGWDLQDRSQCHTRVLIEHQAPECTSSQTFKGILRDQSFSSFEGKIKVASQAQQTEAYQLNANLVLSDLAVAISRPNLEIKADEVKASHGATTGSFDPEELFYMQTRSLSKSHAKALLMKAFLTPVFETIQDQALLEKYGL